LRGQLETTILRFATERILFVLEIQISRRP
jgi:hypothetical protein